LSCGEDMFLWIVAQCRFASIYRRSEKHTVSIFIDEDGSVSRETKVVGNSLVQFRVTAVAQQ
jgi:hypothetical protein